MINDIAITPALVSSKIYLVRGIQVMLDSDLAKLYGVDVKRLTEQVKRNQERFPSDFRFQLSVAEFSDLRSQLEAPDNGDHSVLQKTTSNVGKNLRSQTATSKSHGGRRYLPYVFTEQGVSMLSTVLRSDTAIRVSVQIMRAFVEMRKFYSTNAKLFARLETVEKRQLGFEIKTDQNFERIFKALESTQSPRQGIFYDGQVYDAYTFAADLIRRAKESIVLIDNYIDDTVLTLLSKRNSEVTAAIYTKSVSKQLDLDIKKHNEQYPQIEVHSLTNSHDRFLLLDKKEIYHFGASLKDLGKKWFAFSRFESGALEMLERLGVKG